jgi:FixJ family two-component response regulator
VHTSPSARIVFVVDDDAGVRASIQKLLKSAGLRSESFETAQEFLRCERPDAPSCLVLDLRLPGISGLEFQEQLATAGIYIPIVFVTGHGDIPMSVRAMKAGAVEFLTKPFRDQDLLDAVQRAIQQDRTARQSRAEISRLRQRYDALTPREREVFPFIASGMLNKRSAAELGMRENTIKVHRGHVMHKMGAGSLAELIHMAEKLGIITS